MFGRAPRRLAPHRGERHRGERPRHRRGLARHRGGRVVRPAGDGRGRGLARLPGGPPPHRGRRGGPHLRAGPDDRADDGLPRAALTPPSRSAQPGGRRPGPLPARRPPRLPRVLHDPPGQAGHLVRVRQGGHRLPGRRGRDARGGRPGRGPGGVARGDQGLPHRGGPPRLDAGRPRVLRARRDDVGPGDGVRRPRAGRRGDRRRDGLQPRRPADAQRPPDGQPDPPPGLRDGGRSAPARPPSRSGARPSRTPPRGAAAAPSGGSRWPPGGCSTRPTPTRSSSRPPRTAWSGGSSSSFRGGATGCRSTSCAATGRPTRGSTSSSSPMRSRGPRELGVTRVSLNFAMFRSSPRAGRADRCRPGPAAVALVAGLRVPLVPDREPVPVQRQVPAGVVPALHRLPRHALPPRVAWPWPRRRRSSSGRGCAGSTAVRAEEDMTRPLVMGVVNVTPDSFSDGGEWFDPATRSSTAGADGPRRRPRRRRR